MRFLILSILTILILPLRAIKPDREYIRYPQQAGLIYKRLNVKTRDGYKIETWYFPAQAMPGENAGSEEPLPYKTPDAKKRTTIIICGGDAGNMSYYQLVLAAYYTDRGYNVATFDWRGFGASSEFSMNSNYFCYTEMLSDYESVIAEVVRQPETDTNNVYLLGWSTGGYLSMMTAYENPSVKGCILRGLPTSFDDIIPIIKKETGKTDENLLVPEDFPTDRMPAVIAPYFHKDIMLIVGSEDTRTPVWMSEKIFNSLPAGIVKRIWIAEGAKHGGKEAPEFLYPEDFIAKTVRFIQESESGL